VDSSTPTAAGSSIAVVAPKLTVTSALLTGWVVGVPLVLLVPLVPLALSETVPDVRSAAAIASVPMIRPAPIHRERHRRRGGRRGSLILSAAVRREEDVECMYVPRRTLAYE
jgi:hypothetical protein